ncbi:MAG TPA: hypothetical protein VNN80_30225 [Polyangiaceae bacterium]|nr:hypothetical protein [Polyangiaceae bacterium]
MSVRNMLAIIGVGSAAALIGLVASRRSAQRGATSTSRQRPSGITVRSGGDDPPPDEPGDLPPPPHSLPQGFWDASPESTAEAVESASSRYLRERGEPPDERDALTADWLTRATQAPALDDLADEDSDDPAEIAADSLSMISDASRRAAAQADDDDDEAMSER